ncbi:hypothetical protein JB92DRAFT_3143633 [Gautieria morchelliformis]|nr:hypothetical protein JB92DRAFT_3143633 [Gautieria morchelliformis]
MADVTTVIDDSDPSIKHLTGEWVHFTGDGYYNRTETLTRDAGAASMYTFNGTGISVFGTQCDPPGGNTTVSTYRLDNNGPSKYTEPAGVKCNQNFVNFFTSPPLANGLHTLIITNLNANAWYFLDYLEVTTPGPASNGTAPPTLSSSPVLSSVSSSSSPSSSLQASSSTGTTKLATGVIVGSAIGAAVVASMLILAVMWWRRRRQVSQTHKEAAVRLQTDRRSEELTPYRYSVALNPNTESGIRNTSRKMPLTHQGEPLQGTSDEWLGTASSFDISSQSSPSQTDNTTLPSMVSVTRRPTTSTVPPPYGQRDSISFSDIDIHETLGVLETGNV